jgi:hypothetical protein
MLKLLGVNAVGTTGAVEPIVLNATDTVAVTAADYIDPVSGSASPAAVSADGKTVTITVASGLRNLTVGLSSPNMSPVYATLLSGATALRYATLMGGSGNVVLPVVGQ